MAVAYETVFDLAAKHGVGLFNASSDKREVWMPEHGKLVLASANAPTSLIGRNPAIHSGNEVAALKRPIFLVYVPPVAMRWMEHPSILGGIPMPQKRDPGATGNVNALESTSKTPTFANRI